MSENFNISKKWDKKLDHKSRMLIVESIDAFGDILEHDLFFFPEYTNHKIKHIQNILEISEKLIPKSCERLLTASDIMCYVIAVLYHDIGMHITFDGFLKMIKENCMDGDHGMVYQDKPWNELWDAYVREAKLWSGEKRNQILGKEEGIQKLNVLKNSKEFYVEPGELNTYDRLFIGEFLRRYHCRLAYDIAYKGFPGTGGNIQILPIEWRGMIGHIARSHGENIWKMSDLIREQYKSNYMKCKDTHILYLMVLLRIADYFDLDQDRAAINVSRLFHFISSVSAREWKKNQIVHGIRFGEASDPELLFIETVPPENSSLFLEMQQLLEDMQRELDTSWAVLGDIYGNSRENLKLSMRRIKSDLLDFETREHSVNYLPEKIAFRANTAILKLMVGPLYDYSLELGMRELLQNAVDACKEKKFLCEAGKEEYHGQVTVEIILLDNGKGKICVSDNGIGMTKEVIKNYYLVAGASFRKDPLWKEKYVDPDTQCVRIGRNGRFGVGVLATYLLGHEVHVETTSYLEHTAYEFDAVLDETQLDVYRKPVSGKETGTRITIEVSSEVMESLRKSFVQKWYCEQEPEIVFRYNGMVKPEGGFHPEKVKWRQCQLAAGVSADYCFLEGSDIDRGTYVNGLKVEGGEYEMAVNILEKKEEVSLSLNRNRLLGIGGCSLNGYDIQEEIIRSELFAYLLICNPFVLKGRFRFRRFRDTLEDQILFTNRGFCLMGWLENTLESDIIYLGDAWEIFVSKEKLCDLWEKLGKDADQLYFTYGSLDDSQNGSSSQIRMEMDIGNLWMKLGGFVVSKGYFGAASPDKSIISSTIGMGNSGKFYTKEIGKNGTLYLTWEFHHKDKEQKLIELWEKGAGHPVALYYKEERKDKDKDKGRKSRIFNRYLANVNRYFAHTDKLIPYEIEERKKKFPDAFRDFDLYIKNVSRDFSKWIMSTAMEPVPSEET